MEVYVVDSSCGVVSDLGDAEQLKTTCFYFALTGWLPRWISVFHLLTAKF
uniref:Uncharacterized protein n=1 Tax=Anguilla anguilla TaxID=7936 RepID=A0A0E9VF95_ANGAN